MNIGFDLDGIFIGSPPFLPRDLIEWLYRGPQDHEPKYRFPSTWIEQKIRKWSHQSALRPQISKNVEFLKHFSAQGKHKVFLISSRYSFLKAETDEILKKYQLKKYFYRIYLNSDNLQPHIFKEEILKKLNLDLFIEDDFMLLKYLSGRFSKIKLLWYNEGESAKLPEGIKHIKSLNEIYTYLT